MTMKPLEVKPSQGGRLMTNVSNEVAGLTNYTRKVNVRRYLEREIRAEGFEWFFPNPESWARSDSHPSGEMDPFELVAVAEQTNGRKAVVAGTKTKLYRFYGVDDPLYVESGYIQTGYFGEPGTWVVIGSGYSANGRRWEAVSINGWLVLNNGVDIPVTYRVQDLTAKPIYELRESGVARVGTIANHNGILHCMDVTVINDDRLTRLLSPVPLKSNKSQTGRVRVSGALAVINSGTPGQAGNLLQSDVDAFTGKPAGTKVLMANGQSVTIASVVDAKTATVNESVLVEPNQPFYFPTAQDNLIALSLEEILTACRESALTTATNNLATANQELATASANHANLEAVYSALKAVGDGGDQSAALSAARTAAEGAMVYSRNNTVLSAAITAAQEALNLNPSPSQSLITAAKAAADTARGVRNTKMANVTTALLAVQEAGLSDSDTDVAEYLSDASRVVGLKLYWETGEVRTIVNWQGQGDLIVSGGAYSNGNGRYVYDEDLQAWTHNSWTIYYSEYFQKWTMELSGTPQYLADSKTGPWTVAPGEDGGIEPVPVVTIDTSVEVDSTIPVPSGKCYLENPLAYAVFDEPENSSRFHYRDLFGMPFYPRRWGPQIPVTIDPTSNVVRFKYPFKSVEELNGSNFLILSAGAGGTNLNAKAMFVESNKLVVAGDVTSSAKLLVAARDEAQSAYDLAQEVYSTAVSAVSSAKSSLAVAQSALDSEVPNFNTLNTAVEDAKDSAMLAAEAVEVANTAYIDAQRVLSEAQAASNAAAPSNAALAAAVVAATQEVSAAQQKYQTAQTNYTIAQNAVLIAQQTLNANPKTATLIAAVTTATAQVQTASVSLSTASIALAAAKTDLATATQNLMPTDTYIKAADADAAGIAFEDLIDDGSAILKAMELRNVLVIYKETAIFIAGYTANASQPYVFTKIEIPKGAALLYRNTLIHVKAPNGAFKLSGPSHIYAGRDSFFAFDLTTQMPSEIEELQLCQDVFFQNSPDLETAFACDNETTKEVFIRPSTEAGVEALRMDYKFGTVSTTDMRFFAGAMVPRPVADHHYKDDWFVVGGADGILWKYGRTSEKVRKSGSVTGTVVAQTFTENQSYSGASDPNGNQSGSVGDQYNQILAGIFVKQWIKVTGNNTTTGWL